MGAGYVAGYVAATSVHCSGGSRLTIWSRGTHLHMSADHFRRRRSGWSPHPRSPLTPCPATVSRRGWSRARARLGACRRAPWCTIGDMAPHGAVVSCQFHMGHGGRSVLPVAVRRAAGIADGAVVVARAEGSGRIVIETPEAVRARVWGAAPVEAGDDIAADLRRLRAPSPVRSGASDVSDVSEAVGAALLARLGL